MVKKCLVGVVVMILGNLAGSAGAQSGLSGGPCSSVEHVDPVEKPGLYGLLCTCAGAKPVFTGSVTVGGITVGVDSEDGSDENVCTGYILIAGYDKYVEGGEGVAVEAGDVEDLYYAPLCDQSDCFKLLWLFQTGQASCRLKPPVSAGSHKTYKMSGALCSGSGPIVPRFN